jgi:hypothetical protein
MRKYVDAIVASKEENDKALAPARAAEQQAKLGLEAKQLEISVMEAKNELDELGAEYPLNFEAIIEAQDALALSERRLTQLKDLSVALFS